MDVLREVKPLMISFVYWFLFPAFVFFVVVTIGCILLWMLTDLNAIPVSIVTAVLVGLWILFVLIAYDRYLRYKNYSMNFFSDRMVLRTKGLFSSKNVELLYNRVTHVTCIHPWIQHLLFKTGSVKIESAGSTGAEIRIPHILGSKDVYDSVESLMQQTGFSLAKNNVLIEDAPDKMYTIVSAILSTLFSFFLIMLVFIGEVGTSASGLLSTIATSSWLPWGGFVVLLLITTTIAFVAANRLHEKYIVYDDTVYYVNSIFTKKWSFLPAENLSDCTTSQGILARVMGIYNVDLSVQGSGSEVRFAGLVRGKAFESAVDKLVDTFGESDVRGRRAGQASPLHSMQHHEPSALGESVVYRQNLARRITGVILGYVFIPLMLLISYFILSTVFTSLDAQSVLRSSGYTILTILSVYAFYAAIALFGSVVGPLATTYVARPGRILMEYKFISTRRQEFTNDKITAVVFKRNPFDWLFNTTTVHIKSIGSGENLKLIAIPYNDQTVTQLLATNHIKQSQPEKQYSAQVRFADFFFRNTWFNVFIVLLLFAISVPINIFTSFPAVELAFGLGFVFLFVLYALDVLHYGGAVLFKHASYLHYNEGWIVISDHYTELPAIKDFQSTRYFTRSSGAIKVNIAGEEQIQKSRKNNQSNSSIYFVGHYLQLVEQVYGELNTIYGASSETKLQHLKPQARNGVLLIVLGGLFFFYLLPLTILVMAYYVWMMSVKSYDIYDDRVEMRWGILNKSRKSVYYPIVDHITVNRNFLNTLFGNGNVNVHTTGSGQVEIRIGPIKQFEQTQQIIEKSYQD